MTTLNQKLRDIVRLCTGLTGDQVRPADQVAPAKGDAYATVLIISDVSRGMDSTTWANIPDDEDKRVTETADGQRLITASIQFFRAGAVDYASKLVAAIKMSAAQELMQEHEIGLVRTGAVRNLTQVINEAWEERAQIDIDFHYISSEVAPVTTYGEFPFNISSGPDQTTTFEVFEP